MDHDDHDESPDASPADSEPPPQRTTRGSKAAIAKRRLAVLDHTLAGLEPAEIAELLDVSERTVAADVAHNDPGLRRVLTRKGRTDLAVESIGRITRHAQTAGPDMHPRTREVGLEAEALLNDLIGSKSLIDDDDAEPPASAADSPEDHAPAD